MRIGAFTKIPRSTVPLIGFLPRRKSSSAMPHELADESVDVLT
jgi:hypothetical protein